jgi:hypothetical protein
MEDPMLLMELAVVIAGYVTLMMIVAAARRAYEYGAPSGR